jgi:hypothetical protein
MKKLLLLVVILFTQLLFAESYTDSHISENRGNFKYPKNPEGVMESDFKRKMQENLSISKRLGAIKYEMINGNLEKAKVMLLRSKYAEGFSRTIQYRYLGMIHFIEGNYKLSQKFLTHKSLYNISTNDTICMLRTLNFIILNRTAEAKIEWNICLDATLDKSPTQYVWMNTILKLKLNDEPKITEVPLKRVNIENEKGDYLRLFLKMALYLNQQNKIFERLPFLAESAFKDPEIRELIGMLYYREGKLSKAYNFVEDLDSPNSENIKGNIYLAQKKFELAYGQFKLALKKKVNSQNSLERIIPVAWILKQWDDGLEFIEKLKVDPKDKYNKLTLKAALLTQAGQYKMAETALRKVIYGSNNAQSLEVNQLYTYNALMMKNNSDAEAYADKSCAFKDGINCWILYHFAIWENFTLTTHREDDILEGTADLASELTQSFQEDPIIEDIYVSQEDVEEMDNDIIKLLPNIRE